MAPVRVTAVEARHHSDGCERNRDTVAQLDAIGLLLLQSVQWWRLDLREEVVVQVLATYLQAESSGIPKSRLALPAAHSKCPENNLPSGYLHPGSLTFEACVSTPGWLPWQVAEIPVDPHVQLLW